MELDEVKKIIQDFFQENTVTIVGSGLSLAEGIPGMSALATELLSKLPALLTDSDDAEVWAKIAADLSFGVALEQALHNTKPTPTKRSLLVLRKNSLRNQATSDSNTWSRLLSAKHLSKKTTSSTPTR